MKLLILAAGYATRLYPLTINQPKPLLKVAGKPMLEHVLDRVLPAGGIDEILIVTNDKFAGHFEEWAQGYSAPEGIDVTVINDETTNDENKLGAIGDTHLVIQKCGVDDDLMVVAGDNLFSEDLIGFGETCREKQAPVLGLYDVGTPEAAKPYASVELAEDGRLIDFVEKPENPKTSLIGIALYFYPRAFVPKVAEYVEAGNNADQPGRLIQWLYPQTPVYTWTAPGMWYDIGSKETLEAADKAFSAD